MVGGITLLIALPTLPESWAKLTSEVPHLHWAAVLQDESRTWPALIWQWIQIIAEVYHTMHNMHSQDMSRLHVLSGIIRYQNVTYCGFYPINNGMFTTYQLVQDFSTIPSHNISSLEAQESV